jgi:hypothetical protein
VVEAEEAAVAVGVVLCVLTAAVNEEGQCHPGSPADGMTRSPPMLAATHGTRLRCITRVVLPLGAQGAVAVMAPEEI